MRPAPKKARPDALVLAGGPQRVITLSDPHAGDVGVRLSEPVPDLIRPGLETVMALLASGTLALRPRMTAPLDEVARVHHGLESGEIREKVVLTI